MVLRGYRLQGTDLTGITQEIKKISMSVNKIRARTYAKLLGNEIAFFGGQNCFECVYARSNGFHLRVCLQPH